VQAITFNKMSIDKLIDKYGPPDIVGERAGDLERFYRYNKPQEYVWPKAITKYITCKKTLDS